MFSKLIYKHRKLTGIALIVIIVVGAALLLYSNQGEKEEIVVSKNENKQLITIDIEGAVQKPGIYELQMGSLIQDAINLAGGLLEEADKDKIAKEINRAQELKNGQKIYLSFKTTSSQGSVAGKDQSGLININTANISELDSLPGIGPAYAQRIIDYRSQNGGFSSLEEIMEIKGIGEKTFDKIKDSITI